MRKMMMTLAAVLVALSCSRAMAAAYSALVSDDTQVAKAANTPYAIAMTGDNSASFKIEGSKLTILRDGDYFVTMAAQVGGSTSGDIYLWIRVNGKDVPDSNSIQTIPSPSFTTVLVSQGGMTFKAGDVVEFIYAATKPGLGVIATRPKNMPVVPAVIFTVFEL